MVIIVALRLQVDFLIFKKNWSPTNFFLIFNFLIFLIFMDGVITIRPPSFFIYIYSINYIYTHILSEIMDFEKKKVEKFFLKF